jgi:hypothetical protein
MQKKHLVYKSLPRSYADDKEGVATTVIQAIIHNNCYSSERSNHRAYGSICAATNADMFIKNILVAR